jgi:hypothetical protein
MNTREIRTTLDSELYRVLESAMLNHTLYEGCYVMQYSEHNEHEGKVAVFLLREQSKKEKGVHPNEYGDTD